MAVSDLTAQRLRELFHYVPSTGVFTRRSGPKVGEPCGARSKFGHLYIRVDGRSYPAHRLAFLYMTNEFPKQVVDHINGNSGDNRWSNLRDVSHAVNMQNQRKANKANKSSGLLGVSWHAQRQKWLAYIAYGGKQHSLGLHKTPEEAHAAYLKAKRLHHEGCTI